MPIKVTHSDNTFSVEHRGEVVEVRRSVQSRNHSDTLDYTDFRSTDVLEALVYVGRHAGKGMHRRGNVPAWTGHPDAYYREGEELAPLDRFAWVDCTCLFRDRGQDVREPAVDAIRHPDVVIDYAGFLEAREQKRLADDKAAIERRAKEELDRLAKERNRPVRGKQMVVVSGRKVAPGHRGTVAALRDDSVLLKADHEWQDRRANGVWVRAQYLQAR